MRVLCVRVLARVCADTAGAESAAEQLLHDIVLCNVNMWVERVTDSMNRF